ncbi:MAG: alpha/beta fold hydrolase [Caldilineaceae bacterium]
MRGWGWLGLGMILLYGLYYYLLRQQPLRRLPKSQPVRDYAEALDRLRRLQAAETEQINPVCRTQCLTYGHKTAKVIVLLHGFTNCPYQFYRLAAQFHERGYNVLNIRLPYHGLADRLAPDLLRLTVAEMTELTGEVLDIAHGLGEEVTLLGFSLGGILTGWAAQQRADLACAVLVSPAIGLQAIPAARSQLMANLFALLPNSFRWWDPVHKDAKAEPAHAYPRFATRALAALLQLGCIVQNEAKQAKPAARSILLITNPADTVVDNQVAFAVAQQWRAHGATVEQHEFPADWRLIHDLMDPAQPNQQVERVYPLLLKWITRNPI